jgi:hypothetical protein
VIRAQNRENRVILQATAESGKILARGNIKEGCAEKVSYVCRFFIFSVAIGPFIC